jgi:hypothetical protein
MQDKADAAGARKTHTEHGLRDLGRRIRKHASLPDTVSFASFRKGGMTEMGEAGLTDQLIVGLSGPSDPADGQRLLEGDGAPTDARLERTGAFVGIACRNGRRAEQARTPTKCLSIR